MLPRSQRTARPTHFALLPDYARATNLTQIYCIKWPGTVQTVTTLCRPGFSFFSVRNRLMVSKLALERCFSPTFRPPLSAALHQHQIPILIITIDHLIYDCSILQDERDRLIGKISRHDNWPMNKRLLGNKYTKQFIHFTDTIDFTNL